MWPGYLARPGLLRPGASAICHVQHISAPGLCSVAGRWALPQTHGNVSLVDLLPAMLTAAIPPVQLRRQNPALAALDSFQKPSAGGRLAPLLIRSFGEPSPTAPPPQRCAGSSALLRPGHQLPGAAAFRPIPVQQVVPGLLRRPSPNLRQQLFGYYGYAAVGSGAGLASARQTRCSFFGNPVCRASRLAGFRECCPPPSIDSLWYYPGFPSLLLPRGAAPRIPRQRAFGPLDSRRYLLLCRFVLLVARASRRRSHATGAGAGGQHGKKESFFVCCPNRSQAPSGGGRLAGARRPRPYGAPASLALAPAGACAGLASSESLSAPFFALGPRLGPRLWPVASAWPAALARGRVRGEGILVSSADPHRLPATGMDVPLYKRTRNVLVNNTGCFAAGRR